MLALGVLEFHHLLILASNHQDAMKIVRPTFDARYDTNIDDEYSINRGTIMSLIPLDWSNLQSSCKLFQHSNCQSTFGLICSLCISRSVAWLTRDIEWFVDGRRIVFESQSLNPTITNKVPGNKSNLISIFKCIILWICYRNRSQFKTSWRPWYRRINKELAK